MSRREFKIVPGPSTITLEQAIAAARYVVRDRATGRLTVLPEGAEPPKRRRPKAGSDRSKMRPRTKR